MKKSMLFAAALLLAGCASTGTRDGLVYKDGSWYSPAREGHGDYYTGASRRHHDHYYDVPWAWSVGFVPYGGYCPAMYRYCTSFWADPYYSAGWYPWYYPVAVYVPRPRRPHQDGPAPIDEDPIADRDPFPRPHRDRADRPARPAREPGNWGGHRGGDGGSARARRRDAAAEGGRD